MTTSTERIALSLLVIFGLTIIPTTLTMKVIYIYEMPIFMLPALGIGILACFVVGKNEILNGMGRR